MIEEKLPQTIRSATMQPTAPPKDLTNLFAAFQRAALKKIANTGANIAKNGKQFNALDFDLSLGNDLANDKGYLRVGDTISILYDEKVYD